MTDIQELYALMFEKDNIAACNAAKKLFELSGETDDIYKAFFPSFSELLCHKNSYQRNRRLVLTAVNSCWMTVGEVEQLLPLYLACLHDKKPITARICIQNLAQLALNCPSAAPKIIYALEHADFSEYRDSMSPLLEKDRSSALELITQKGE